MSPQTDRDYRYDVPDWAEDLPESSKRVLATEGGVPMGVLALYSVGIVLSCGIMLVALLGIVAGIVLGSAFATNSALVFGAGFALFIISNVLALGTKLAWRML